MYHRLRDGLSWCVFDQHTVFLDLARDRYFCLRRDDNRRFQEWTRSETLNDMDIARLIGAGVLVDSDSQPLPPTAARTMPLTVDLAENSGRAARWVDIARCLLAQHRAASVIRRGNLADKIAAISRGWQPALPAEQDGAEAVRRIAAAFASTPLAFHKAEQCLPRALAANGLCRAAGVATTLVFGVQLQPFGAHCWLQWGAAVVVGDLEQARMFTPILAVP